MLVVTNGPVAMAGSISTFRKNIGIKVPTATAISIEQPMLNPTTTPSMGSTSINRNFAKRPSNKP